MLVLAADHIINNQAVFHKAIGIAEQYALADHLVTFDRAEHAGNGLWVYSARRGVDRR